MTSARITAILGLAAAALAIRAEGYELNAWPVYVAQKDPGGQTLTWTGAGPFLFSSQAPAPDAGTAEGFRPFYVKVTGGGSVKTDILYPLFFYRHYPDSYKWSILQLINGEGVDSGVTRAGGPEDKHFDIWPFYFSHVTGDPVDDYRAVMPIAGTIKYRLGYDRLSWVLFPLYVDAVKKHTETTYTPWPIIRVIKGEQNGFAIWPLFGVTSGPGAARHSFYVWPLIWNNVLEPTPEAPPGAAPGTEFGILPLYTRETAPGMISENFLWPFFGYTHRTIPYRYSETRYFWPFLVQGKGDDRVLDRWGPFYTYSYTKGADSKWVAWPFWHQKRWVDDDTSQHKTQFFYFIYWSLYQTSVSRPYLAPAYKRHFWPFVSIWDNGAGSKQVQIPSLFEIFFPDNPDMRETWSPLVSIYKYDRQPTGETRHSILWSAVTWRSTPSEGLAEFHVGPLLGMRRAPSGDRWTILGFDFGAKQDNPRAAYR